MITFISALTLTSVVPSLYGLSHVTVPLSVPPHATLSTFIHVAATFHF
ncbi:MAG: hypothetical protein AAGD34_20365 [Pseudomonadota bacterium]